jgi:hypothetical protein
MRGAPMTHKHRLLGALLLLFAGCSSGLCPVSGTVTFDGEPVEEGEVVFMPVDPKVRPDAEPIQNGSFNFQASPGPKRVEIRASRVIGTTSMGPRKEQFIPVRYNDQSTLTEEVKPSSDNHFTFTLTGDKPKR